MIELLPENAKSVPLNKLNTTKICGVYFLIESNQVVYVGKSSNIMSRIRHHSCDEEKQFDSFAYVEFDSREIVSKEAEFIRLFKPTQNKNIKNYTPDPNKICWTNQRLRQLKEEHNLTIDQIKDLTGSKRSVVYSWLEDRKNSRNMQAAILELLELKLAAQAASRKS